MKTLYLIRHAKASWDDPAETDHDRPLTSQGELDAKSMGGQLKELKIKPDLILSSTANRSLQTAILIAEIIGFPVEQIVTSSHIYTGGVEELLGILKSLNKTAKTVFFFGHNPSLTWLAHYLCEETRVNISTCGILSLAFNIATWQALTETEGKFLQYFHPQHEHA
jgi:phosphohistidine phosphatase